jgi:nicotinate-nucleotide--dimethylbenzimidazole phosphoribosyltransferase
LYFSRRKMGKLLDNTIDAIKRLDDSVGKLAQSRLDSLTKPRGSLGRLEDIAVQISSITGTTNPDLGKKLIVVAASDHGITEEGVSAYPKEVTAQMIYNFLKGGAGINVLARHVGADVVVVDAGVAGDLVIEENDGTYESIFINRKIDFGTKNMAKGPAMTVAQAVQSVETGISIAMEMTVKGYGIIGTGDMGIGNTTSSSAITSCICGVEAALVTGYGTGIDEKGYNSKVEAIKRSLYVNKPDSCDGIDVLSKVGGFEIGVIAGLVIGCAAKSTPVVIDGFISGAGALIAVTIAPACRDYIIASHCSVEKGHRIILEKIGTKPLFNFDMRLGEGTGAAIGIGICQAAMMVLNEMATFGEAGVSAKE